MIVIPFQGDALYSKVSFLLISNPWYQFCQRQN